MSVLEVDFSEFNDFADWLESEEAQEVCLRVALAVITEWENRAVAKSPADTGVLRQSWFHTDVDYTSDSYKSYLINDAVGDDGAPYPLFVNNGHRIVSKDGKELGFYEGQHFLEDATEETLKKIEGIWIKEVVNWWSKYGK